MTKPETKTTFDAGKRHYHYGLGKRKCASARARVYADGKGIILVNGIESSKYFLTKYEQDLLTAPFELLGLNPKKFDITILVRGGGRTGQAAAIRHAVSKSLVEMNDENRVTLKRARYTSRDPRMVMTKTYGRPKARRSKQWSKR